MRKIIAIIAVFAVIIMAFTSVKTVTPEDAKKVVESFMRQIDFVVNGSGKLDDRKQSAETELSKLIYQGGTNQNVIANPAMSNDLQDGKECKQIAYNTYLRILRTEVKDNGLSYKCNYQSIKYLDTGYKVDYKSGADEPSTYVIETSQIVNGMTKGFRFSVDIETNKIKRVTLTSCPLPQATNAETAHINAETNYTNNHHSEAFNDYILALQLNPKDGEAYYRLAVMYYRGIGCKKNYKKVSEYLAKALQYGNPRIQWKAQNFKEYIER